MNAPSLQQAIDQAGSPINLLWKEHPSPWKPPGVEDEYAGWRQEQAAWRETVALSDLSHHMSDTFIQGPDARALLEAVSANDYDHFEVGQAKQFVPVTSRGLLVTDGILMRDAPDRFVLTSVGTAENWVRYHGEIGGYDVEMEQDPDSGVRPQGGPKVYRYQVQGPLAPAAIAKALGGPAPEVKFFHSAPVRIGDFPVRALRHGMAGQPGFEFIGPWEDAGPVKEALLRAGEEFGIRHVGAFAYSGSGVESGWVADPHPAIYTDDDLRGFREWTSLFTYEGMFPLHGSYFSEDIEDYYVSPWELGYGRSISFDHDFIGRDALREAQAARSRTKVTLEVNREDLHELFEGEVQHFMSHGRYRIESDAGLVGMTFYTTIVDPVGTVLALSLVDDSVAEPGTEVTLVWGQHPGPGATGDPEAGFRRVRATVQPAPYDAWARTQYRKN
jgi:vanillate/3-O-methylgallate O-demethylase